MLILLLHRMLHNITHQQGSRPTWCLPEHCCGVLAPAVGQQLDEDLFIRCTLPQLQLLDSVMILLEPRMQGLLLDIHRMMADNPATGKDLHCATFSPDCCWPPAPIGGVKPSTC